LNFINTKIKGKGVNLEQKAFSLDDILVKSFEPKKFHGVWINGINQKNMIIKC
jgi:hypothetical protein